MNTQVNKQPSEYELENFTTSPIWGLKHWITVYRLQELQDIFVNKTYSDIRKIKKDSLQDRPKFVVKRLMEAIEDLKYKHCTINDVMFAKLETSKEVIDAVNKLCTCLSSNDAMLGPLSIQYTMVMQKVSQKLEMIKSSAVQYDCKLLFYTTCYRVENNPTFQENEKQRFKEWRINLYKYNRV